MMIGEAMKKGEKVPYGGVATHGGLIIWQCEDAYKVYDSPVNTLN